MNSRRIYLCIRGLPPIPLPAFEVPPHVKPSRFMGRCWTLHDRPTTVVALIPFNLVAAILRRIYLSVFVRGLMFKPRCPTCASLVPHNVKRYLTATIRGLGPTTYFDATGYRYLGMRWPDTLVGSNDTVSWFPLVEISADEAAARDSRTAEAFPEPPPSTYGI